MNTRKTAGNRFNLRSEWYNQIKKVDSVSNVLGSLSNVLVTTWGGLFMGMGTLALGMFLIIKMITANGMHTLVANIPAIILVLIGTILIALNVALTNPSLGAQIKVSLRFLALKFLGTQTVVNIKHYVICIVLTPTMRTLLNERWWPSSLYGDVPSSWGC